MQAKQFLPTEASVLASHLPNTACTRRVGVGGIFKHFFWLWVFPVLRANPRSAHTQLTHAVRWLVNISNR